MKKLLTILTPLTLMGLAGVTPAQAAIVAGWNSFNASTASYPKAADNVGANITSTGLDTAGLLRYDLPDFTLTEWNTGSTVDTSQYVEFAVQPGAGFQVDFTNLQLNGGGVSTPEPSGIVGLIAVGALGAASLRRRG